DRLGVGPGGGLLQGVAGLVQDAGDGGGAGGQGGAAQQQGADLLATPVGVALLKQEDGPLGQVGQATAGRAAFGLVEQPARPLGREAALPVVEGGPGQADRGGGEAGWAD